MHNLGWDAADTAELPLVSAPSSNAADYRAYGPADDAGYDPNQAPEQRQAPKRRRRHKGLLTVGLLILLLIGTVGSWGLYLGHKVGSMTTFALDVPASSRPAAIHGARTFLIAGLDDGRAGDVAGALASDNWQPGVYRSDVIMLAHIPANHNHAYIISIPRDSWVEIPGHGKNKINAAFSLGGPSLLVQTTEQLTGIRMDHTVIADWHAFIDISSAIGGVDVYVPKTVFDSGTGRTWTKGTHTLEGEDALYYVRQRHGLPGGDFSRVQRQQNFLRATMSKLGSKSTILNPITVTHTVSALTENLVVDEDFGATSAAGLAWSVKGLRSKDVTFMTIPNNGAGMAGSASVVFLDEPANTALFKAMRAGTLDTYFKDHDVQTLPDGTSVR